MSIWNPALGWSPLPDCQPPLSLCSADDEGSLKAWCLSFSPAPTWSLVRLLSAVAWKFSFLPAQTL